eukprot:1160277-Pelagomonas_calceolata.AAC.6
MPCRDRTGSLAWPDRFCPEQLPEALQEDRGAHGGDFQVPPGWQRPSDEGEGAEAPQGLFIRMLTLGPGPSGSVHRDVDILLVLLAAILQKWDMRIAAAGGGTGAPPPPPHSQRSGCITEPCAHRARAAAAPPAPAAAAAAGWQSRKAAGAGREGGCKAEAVAGGRAFPALGF